MTIDDNDGPTLTIGHETVDEAGNAYLEVRLSSPAVQAVSFDWATADGSAKAGKDYEPKSSDNQTIAIGESSVVLSVKTLEDTTDEPDENFFVNVTDVHNAQGRALIMDDDAAPKLSLVGPTVEVEEGKDAVFTVTLDAASGKTVSVTWATSDGTALAAADYGALAALSGSLSFAPGETSKTITVRTTQDNDKEADEDFKVTLSDPANATILTAQDTATIGASD